MNSSSSSSPETARHRVLFIDDEETILSVMARFCDVLGIESQGTSNGNEAVALAKDFDPHLIFLDLMMPEIGGFEVLRRLKSDPVTAQVPVVMLSSEGHRAEARVEGIELGAMDFLAKPIRKHEFEARLKRYLQVAERTRITKEERAQILRKTGVYLKHSINNLLATIQVCAELTADEAGADDSDEMTSLRESVQEIQSIIGRLTEIEEVVFTSYAGLEEMLDLNASSREKGGTPQGPEDTS